MTAIAALKIHQRTDWEQVLSVPMSPLPDATWQARSQIRDRDGLLLAEPIATVQANGSVKVELNRVQSDIKAGLHTFDLLLQNPADLKRRKEYTANAQVVFTSTQWTASPAFPAIAPEVTPLWLTELIGGAIATHNADVTAHPGLGGGGGGGGGEVNTASNVGTGGIGVFKQKTGANLELRNINVGSSRLAIALDAPTNEIRIDLGTVATSDITGLVSALNAKQGLDPDLTAIALLAPADGSIIQRQLGTWGSRTPSEFKSDLLLVKADIGLANVDNTTDLLKPISTATQTALDGKANTSHTQAIATVTGLQVALDGKQPAFTLVQLKTDLALNNVDNTSDVNKPISTATQTALNTKAATTDPRFTDQRVPTDGSVTDAKIGDRTVDQALATPANTGTLTALLSWIAGRLKAITGEASWLTAPSISLVTTAAHVANTSNPHGVTRSQLGVDASALAATTFLVTTTHVLPANWTTIARIVMHGGGGSGTGGGKQPTGTQAGGGGGGGGGGSLDIANITRAYLEALFGSSVTHLRVTIGAGGAASLGATTNASIGANGLTGGDTTIEFGNGTTWILLYSVSGGNGGSGTSAGAALTASMLSAAGGGGGSSTGTGSTGGNAGYSAGGGGGGGGKTAANAASSGGNRGAGGRVGLAGGGSNTGAGSTGGGNGANGDDGRSFTGGNGGGGGGSRGTDGNGGSGGLGGFPGGGGGGGGAGTDTGNGGNSGKGGDGVVYLFVRGQ